MHICMNVPAWSQGAFWPAAIKQHNIRTHTQKHKNEYVHAYMYERTGLESGRFLACCHKTTR